MKILPGMLVKDSITGYTGVVICRSEWLYGCVRLSVASVKLIDDKVVKNEVFDEPQLHIINASTEWTLANAQFAEVLEESAVQPVARRAGPRDDQQPREASER